MNSKLSLKKLFAAATTNLPVIRRGRALPHRVIRPWLVQTNVCPISPKLPNIRYYSSYIPSVFFNIWCAPRSVVALVFVKLWVDFFIPLMAFAQPVPILSTERFPGCEKEDFEGKVRKDTMRHVIMAVFLSWPLLDHIPSRSLVSTIGLTVSVLAPVIWFETIACT